MQVTYWLSNPSSGNPQSNPSRRLCTPRPPEPDDRERIKYWLWSLLLVVHRRPDLFHILVRQPPPLCHIDKPLAIKRQTFHVLRPPLSLRGRRRSPGHRLRLQHSNASQQRVKECQCLLRLAMGRRVSHLRHCCCNGVDDHQLIAAIVSIFDDIQFSISGGGSSSTCGAIKVFKLRWIVRRDKALVKQRVAVGP